MREDGECRRGGGNSVEETERRRQSTRAERGERDRRCMNNRECLSKGIGTLDLLWTRAQWGNTGQVEKGGRDGRKVGRGIES